MTKNLYETVVSRVKYAWFENIGVWESVSNKTLGYGYILKMYVKSNCSGLNWDETVVSRVKYAWFEKW